ncbi:MAG: envelope stress response membrane protein PspC [Deltaproteobacteria bacterium]|nr:envelope stress response membrane protein PspC [Deltaproteobacteria bacterium]
MRRVDKILRGGIYRSRNGMILGVCRGVAEYFNFSVFWTRAIVILLLFITGLWPITGLYFVAALLMKPEPVIPIHDDEEQEFYHSYVHSRRGAAERLKRRFKNLERRIQRMEHTVTQREYDWESKLNL